MTMKDSRGWLLLVSLIVVVADRVTKWLAATRIELGDHVIVIPHIFAISHVENPGAAFSLFNDSSSPVRVRWMLLVFSLLAAVAVLVALLKLGRRVSATTVALAAEKDGGTGDGHAGSEPSAEDGKEPESGRSPEARSKSSSRDAREDERADDTPSPPSEPADAGNGDTVGQIKRRRRSRARNDAEEAA